MIDEIRDDQRKRLRRHHVAVLRDCSMGVIAFENLTWADCRARIVDLSATGLGIESDHPIEPGVIWFKESVYGQKCGVLVWCNHNGFCYRAGIQFVTLNQSEEKYLQRQVEQSQPCQPLLDPERVVAKLIESLKRDYEGNC